MVGSEPVNTPGSDRINVPLDAADAASDVLIGLRQAGVQIASVSVSKPTLDEVFLAITGHDTAQAAAAGATSSNTNMLVEVS